MDAHVVLKKRLIRMGLLAFVALFAVPLLSLWFASHVQSVWTHEMQVAMVDGTSVKVDSAEMLKLPTLADFCASADSQMHDEVCGRFSYPWQFYWAERVAVLALLVGLLAAVVIGIATFMAQRSGAELAAFSFGWQGLRLTTSTSVLLQGALVCWLSFWLTAYFMEIYALKLILIAVVLAAGAAWSVINAIFRRAKLENKVAGVLLPEHQAPMLWARIRQLAQALRTEPPSQIIVGIDTNFFVTQTPLSLPDGTKTQGRSLFLSLPLLRILDAHEADAVLAHELSHFAGGDTQFSAALGPKLQQFHSYTAHMQNSLAGMVLPVLELFRGAFEFVLQRHSREREFDADHAAAKLTSPFAISASLVKIAGYASYRARVEYGLFSATQKHEKELGMRDQITRGLSAFTQSKEFDADMLEGNTPHPFDSHPPLSTRMQSVGHVILPEHYSALLQAPVQSTWASSIEGAQELERIQWVKFEQNFASAHAESLAYRGDPSLPQERDTVLQKFPDQQFTQKSGAMFEINVFGLRNHADGAFVEWDRVKSITYNNGSFASADQLIIEHPEKAMLGSKTTVFKIKVEAKIREPLKEKLGVYWSRHQFMRAYQAGHASNAAVE